MRRALGLLLFAVFGLLAMAPAAEATHTYGHRYIVLGRVLDAQGNPVQEQAVTITLFLGSSEQGSIRTNTDCRGDYNSEDGTIGSNTFTERSANGKLYFHYHSSQLSNQIRIEFVMGSETWENSFRSEWRYTFDRHQTVGTFDPSPTCGDYGQFNSTFQMDAHVLEDRELDTVPEKEVPRRAVQFELESNGTTTRRNVTGDSNGRAVASFTEAQAVAAGDTVTISHARLEPQTITLTDEDVKYRRADAGFKIDPPATESKPFNWVPWLVVGGIVGVGFGGWVLFDKIRTGREMKQAYEQSTRRRARRKP